MGERNKQILRMSEGSECYGGERNQGGTQECVGKRCNFKWIMRNPRIKTGSTQTQGKQASEDSRKMLKMRDPLVALAT